MLAHDLNGAGMSDGDMLLPQPLPLQMSAAWQLCSARVNGSQLGGEGAQPVMAHMHYRPDMMACDDHS